jgi:DNA-binding transcriptional regulator YiaG
VFSVKKAKDQPGSEPAELASLVGERIKKIRKEEGLSLELFALRCDMNAAYIGHTLSPVMFPVR